MKLQTITKNIIIQLLTLIVCCLVIYKLYSLFSTPTIVMSPDLIKTLEVKLGFIQTLEHINNLPSSIPKGDYKIQLEWLKNQWRIGKVGIILIWQIHNWAENIANTHPNPKIRAEAKIMAILTEEAAQKMFSAIGENT